MHFPFTLIDVTETIDGIKMCSNKNIAVMKIKAILGRGEKKYFWDLYEFLKIYCLSEIINFYKQKYPTQMLLILIPNAITNL